MADRAASNTPHLSVAALDAVRDSGSGLWRVRWQITNRGHSPVRVRETWLPHGLFHGDREVLSQEIVLTPGASREIISNVSCSPRPGDAIENAFLILGVECGGGWRVLAQLRVDSEDRDSIKPVVEKVTPHPVGFAQKAQGGS